MRIVQTFWTAGRDPLQYSFGWLHPEYNLMSWALSCLSLREHYDEVALYTDEQGKHVLIDLLHLPYTEVHVVYDEYLCLPQHWAYAKIKTYSLQDKPFLHVDGDVYLPKPIPDEIINAPLIAQNREIGTRYYQQMLGRMLKYPEIILPGYAEEALAENSVVSYNMGLFGGHDIDFIHKYCNEVFQFIASNHLNDPAFRQSHANCNVFFEQNLFAILADKENRHVASVLGKEMIDNGYTAREFCALRNYNKQFFHVLGGHKRNIGICNILEKTLLQKHQEFFMDITSLFKDRHIRIYDSLRGTNAYIDDIPLEDILKEECLIVNAYAYVDKESTDESSCIVERNRFLRLSYEDGKCFATIPSLGETKDKTIQIGQLAENFLLLLENGEISLLKLKEDLASCFSTELMDKKDDLVQEEMVYLLLHGIIHIKY